ncbi:MAG: orotate phosphoribosyltransferase [Methanosphaera sp. rholeuAM6]|nr:MAG: orotate phosphoribosyltransferase [Methanosphaera sp. rholeuAM6]
MLVDYKEKLLKLLKDNDVIKFGEFTLSSGKKSDYYVDMKKAITMPEILDSVAHLITQKIENGNIDKIAGPALGAVPIATATSLISKKPMLMIRKEKKAYGTSKQIEGELVENDNVVIVEDVTTTGGSLLKAINVIKDNGGNITEAFVIVDREEGARESFEKENIKFTPLLTITEFKEYLNLN